MSAVKVLSLRNALNKSVLFLFCFLLQAMLLFANDDFVYDSKGKRNPFTPLVTSDGRLLKLDVEENRQDLQLEGVIFDQSGISFAIVNAKVLKLGEMINGYRVLKIEKDKVIFIKEGQLFEAIIKKEEDE